MLSLRDLFCSLKVWKTFFFSIKLSPTVFYYIQIIQLSYFVKNILVHHQKVLKWLSHHSFKTASKQNKDLMSVPSSRLSLSEVCFFLWFFFFWCGPFLNLLNLLQYCLCFMFVFWPRGMWDLSFLTRDQTCTPCVGKPSLNPWITTEVPV